MGPGMGDPTVMRGLDFGVRPSPRPSPAIAGKGAAAATAQNGSLSRLRERVG